MNSWDPLGAIKLLSDEKVDFVLIGGLAASLLGSTSVTDDTDVCHSREEPNLQRLAAALKKMSARLRGVDEDVPFQLDARTLAAGMNFTFATDFGSLDCLGQPAGVSGYEELARNATELPLGDIAVKVSSIMDLKLMKQAAGRPKDLIELEILGALEQELDQG
jgi:hypothetical protein